MNNSVVLGWGTVGKATAEAFQIDKYYSRGDSNISISEIAKCKYIFVCLPTPTVNGRNYVDDITALIKHIWDFPESHNAIFIIRSTVYPGYSRFLQKSVGVERVVSNPEFLSEDTAVEDAKKPDIIVIGGDDVKSREDVVAYYRGRFKYCKPFVTDSVTAELIKYTLNGFFATKVLFANEIYDYAQKVGANYETVKQALYNHPWGTKNHLTVFHKGGRGFSGKCLPKDLEAMYHQSKSRLFFTISDMNRELLKQSNKV